ncbi:MAG: molybdopterin cofactor-binding domain-containing protein [Thermodesulfobacteriota bacterium]|jgi:CO/xanthine dehydrogenase Mo-binding subunit
MLVALYWCLSTPNFFILFNTVTLVMPSVPAAWDGLPPASLEVTAAWSTLPRATAFLVHGFRLAVHCVTGEIRILQSVQVCDASTILNPMQARGQVESGIAQGIGTTLFERMVLDDHGAVINSTLRNYRIPAFADITRSEVFFAKTNDPYGPLGAKPFGESPVIPVSAASGNALADATGLRFTSLPFSADRIYGQLAELGK